MNLNELQIGDYAKVIKVKGHDNDRQHLLDMGLIPGIDVEVVKRAPMGDPIEISLHGYNLAIKNSYAENIIIEKKDKLDLYDLSCIGDCSNCKNRCDKYNILKDTENNNVDSSNIKLKDELINETEHPGFGEEGRFHNKNNENPLPEDKTITFALVGNQNSGKTTLFNVLTGSSKHVGNFPGVTIDRADGVIKGYKNTKITDLPGIYSLSPYSDEEVISREFILKDDVDCIINIIDATNIERSLYLTMQLLQLEHPMVIALNMMDEVSKNQGSILVNKLEYLLGVPIVPISAIKNEGIGELKEHAIHIAKFQELPLKQDFCNPKDRDGSVHRALHSIMHIIEDHCSKNPKTEHLHLVPVRFAAEKIAENDNLVIDTLKLNKEDKEAIEQILTQMEKQCDLDRCALIAEMRYSYILKICKKCVIKGKPSIHRTRSNKIDELLTGKWSGIPSFIVIMSLVFWLTFNVFGGFLQQQISNFFDFASNHVSVLMQNSSVNPVIQSFVIDGIFAGVGTLVGFLPIILVMFFFLSILEDSGYMARVAFVMDKLLRKIGLSGRSIVPMLIGFGCSVPAIMATRTLPSERDRKLTIYLIPFMSCSAKLPVYAFISSIFFGKYAVLVMMFLYFFGIFIGIIIALIFKGKSKPVPFIMELPNYRFPTIKNVLHLLWDKCKDFLQRAFTVILIATIVIWFLQSFDLNLMYTQVASESILAKFAGLISPIFAPIGLGDWRLVTSLLSGFMMKESVVASLAVLFSGSQEILSSFSIAVSLSFLTFCLLYTPCVAAINSARRELGFKDALFIAVFQCVIAWVCSFLIFYASQILFNF